MNVDNITIKLQQRLLEMLKWYHSFCQEHNLRYYALGGTMLGAVRHKGFIPWDDDIDVGMPRKDYEVFLKLMKQYSGNYRVESPYDKNADYIYGYAKIYDTTTTLVEKARRNVIRGIYIDLFPLDGAGMTVEEAEAVFRPIYKEYSLVVARSCALSKRRKWYKNCVVMAARLIPGGSSSVSKELLKINTNSMKYDFDNSAYVGNFLGNWGFRETMRKENMGTPQKYQFENTVIMGSEDADAYLTSLYGEWRKLPPKDKQISHHDFVKLDLNKSYL